MAWKLIEGYKYPYRISDQGEIQKWDGKRWRTLKPYCYNRQPRIHLWLPDGTWKRVLISKLVADAFLGGTPPGMCRAHRNGMVKDNAAENIVFKTRAEAAVMRRPGNSRPVLKVDRAGNVVAIYQSTAEAARANHISQAAIGKRCLGLIADPYRLDGFNYVYEEKRKKKGD